MRLVDDWKWVITKAWSIRLMVVAAVLSGFEVAIQVLVAWQVTLPLPPGLFAALSGIVTCSAFIARIIAQRGTDEA